jgi:hypothetical protein
MTALADHGKAFAPYGCRQGNKLLSCYWQNNFFRATYVIQ